MIFFQCAPLIHHAGHISFRGHRPVRLAVAPHMPCSLAWSAVLGVMARRSAEAEGHGVHPLTSLRGAGVTCRPVPAEVLAPDRPWGPPKIAWVRITPSCDLSWIWGGSWMQKGELLRRQRPGARPLAPTTRHGRLPASGTIVALGPP